MINIHLKNTLAFLDQVHEEANSALALEPFERALSEFDNALETAHDINDPEIIAVCLELVYTLNARDFFTEAARRKARGKLIAITASKILNQRLR